MKKFYLKHKEIIDYIIAGVLTTIVAFVAYKITTLLLISFGPMHDEEGNASNLLIIIAQIVQWVLSVAFAFVVNKIFVFRNKEKDSKTLIKQIATFAGARVVTWFLETGIILGGTWLFVKFGWFTLPEKDPSGFIEKVFYKVFTADFVAKCIAAVVVVITNYFISKLIVFRKKPVSGEEK